MAEEIEKRGPKRQRPSEPPRVYLHDVHDEWRKEREKFINSSSKRRRRSDAEFASHLLQVHARYCTHERCLHVPSGTSRLPIPSAGLSAVPTSPPFQLHHITHRPLPRMTPIKIISTWRSLPTMDSMSTNQPSDSHASQRVVGSVTGPLSDQGPSCHSALLPVALSSGATTGSRTDIDCDIKAAHTTQSSLSDHTYYRRRVDSTPGSDLLEQSKDSARSVPAQETVTFEPAFTSTPHGKVAFSTARSASVRRKELFATPSTSAHQDHMYCRREKPLLLSEADSDTDDPQIPLEQTFPEHVPTTSGEPFVVEDEVSEGLDLHVFDLDLGANEVISDDEEDDDGEEPEEMKLINEKKCIVVEDRLLELVKLAYGETCRRCGDRFIHRIAQKGIAIIVIWECRNGHGSSWRSQHRYNGMYAGNLQTTAAIVMSGNSFQKIGAMAKFLNLRFMVRSTFDRVQKLYVSPAVDRFYKNKQSELLATYNGPVALSGDARSDSPGHCSTFCTYSFCDEQSGRILHTATVMVQESAGKSPNMERIAFIRGLDFLLSKIQLDKLVTDAHPQIAATMKRTEAYQNIRHQWDIWHASKNLVKKLTAAAQEKNCSDLQPWIRKISNHFWHAAQTCDKDPDKLAGILAGVLHHVVNEHEWHFTIDGRQGRCDHGPLEDAATPWLTSGSPAHEKLREIIMNKRFLKSMPYYSEFLHTGYLESFHSVLLMYASKRTFFHLEGYSARVQLAILDTNFHANRKQAKTKDGKLRWGKRWNKRTKHFVVYPIKEPKTYAYVPLLIAEVFRMRTETDGHLSQHVSLAEDDPRRIHPTIAMRPSRPISELIEEHQSRFK